MLRLNGSAKINQLAERLFKKNCSLCLWGLGFLLLVATAFILYLYAWPAVNQSDVSPTAAGQIKIDQALYEKVFQRLDQREANIQTALNKTHPDIFR